MAKTRPAWRPACAAALMIWAAALLAACSSDKDAETEPPPPPKPSYHFDIGQSKALYIDAANLHAAGNDAATIGKLREAIGLFPMDPRPYRLMIDAAKKMEDAEALHFARFFDARLPSIEKLGPWVASLHFKSAGNDDRDPPIKDPAIRANARRVAAYLSAMICDADRKRARSEAEQLSYIRRYGVEALVGRVRSWFEEIPENCPDVSVQ